MKKLNVLQINKYWYPKGGSETVLFAMNELLESHGHTVIPFAMQDEKNVATSYNRYFVNHVDFQKREGFLSDIRKAVGAIYSFEAQKKLEQLIADTRPDIAHLHNFHTQLTPAIIRTLKKHNIPVVWTMHDVKVVDPQAFPQPDSPWAQRLVAWLEITIHKYILHTYDLVDLYIAPSKYMRKKIMEWGVPSDRVVQLYNFTEADGTMSASEGAYVLFVGRLSVEKGVDVALKAMKDLPNLELKVIGDGPLRTKLEDYIHIHDMHNVSLLGYRGGDELSKGIAGSLFVVVPSTVAENNPVVILDAFAHGKPVIGSNLGGIPELLINGDNRGVLVEPNNGIELSEAIKDLAADSDRIAQLGKAGREFVEEKCSPEWYYEQLMERYVEKLDSPANSEQAQSGR